MARKRKKKSNTIFKRKGARRKPRSFELGPGLKPIFTVIVIVFLLAGIVVGFFYLEKYVRTVAAVSENIGTLELVNPPGWVNEALKEKIYRAARANGEDLKIDEGVAQSVQRNVNAYVSWLENIQVQSSETSIRISAKWRRPVAIIKFGLQKFYVNDELFVLDYVPIPELPIVEVKGLAAKTQIPQPGSVWQHADLAAAVELIGLLNRMDQLVTPKKPLLYEIESIDVSNFDGRDRPGFAHIILYAKDKTEIMWGAEAGTWHRYLEASDEEKLAKLYSHYKEYGSLMNNVKYIKLNDPQQVVPRPTDRY
ncbi:MAG: cell division protein FtsQ/DivIB [Planctomycetota bacterium]